MNFKEIIKDEINQKLTGLCAEKTELYLVGGYIRDILLEKDCFDRDYVVVGMPATEFARHVAELFDGYYILLDEKHDIARVVLQDKINTLDFAGCVGENIYTDINNRDYTINTMALSLKDSHGELIDPLNGKLDIENKTIKSVSEKNLVEDPLRLMRAFRLAAQFGFDIDKPTLSMIKKHAQLLNNVAFERINAELVKLFEAESTSENLVKMKETELLFVVFPELIPQKDVPANRHHHLCLIDHSIETVKQVEINLKSFPEWAKAHIYSYYSNGIKTISLLKTAALLHDLGKPATWSIDDQGRHRFIKHEEVGAVECVDVLKHLRYSKHQINYITLLIKNHLYPSQLIREGLDIISDKAIMRFFRRITDHTPDLLLLALADRLSARGPEITQEAIERNIKGTYILLQRYNDLEEDVKTIPKLITGKEVMEMLNMKSGPKVGNILKELKEEQISGNINTRQEAVKFVENYKKQFN